MSKILEFKQQLANLEKNFKKAVKEDFLSLKERIPKINFIEMKLFSYYNDEGHYNIYPMEDDICLNIKTPSGYEDIELSLNEDLPEDPNLTQEEAGEILNFCKNVLFLDFDAFLPSDSELYLISINSEKFSITQE
jgi:hypothetical protein